MALAHPVFLTVVAKTRIDSVTNTYLIERCGLRPLSSPSILLMVASQCTFVSSCSFPAVLELGLRVNTLGTSSVTYEVGVFEKGVEEVKAVGGYTHVCCDSSTRRPIKMDTTFREGLREILVQSEGLVGDKKIDSKL